VRLTSHDGMPFMVLEALSRGRHVIYTYVLPGVVHARGFEVVCEALRDLRDRHDRGELALNREGIAWAREHFEPGEVLAAIDARLKKLVG